MTTKYELTDDTIKVTGRTLHRIRAVTAIAGLGIAAGTLGGYVEAEANLSQYGDAWVYDDARVYGTARVSGNARVYGTARVSGNAQVSGDAWVYDDARVYDDAQVSGDAWVSGLASRSPLVISGLAYTVTLDDTHMTAGCQSHPLREWLDADEAKLRLMDGKAAVDFRREFGGIIQQLAVADGRLSAD
ncbi:hypothetical protein QQS45_08515 [Alteriqipengyuania flavescens]|uniref:hypothetical protein n=1 Tax=Alteriqipengyuania flavescens TaxID=3053610 RepID=UPI0025B2A1F0|nr:hypothetical protein [Alteriqipengyuania flavescens]WJY17689.1 hypothetical protein QQW98_08510 [Alteriqipengyuania flavescens]WJY23632.1 hypothetical protein QQS45_08515 [Alteriqipengyuania flavescens]